MNGRPDHSTCLGQLPAAGRSDEQRFAHGWCEYIAALRKLWHESTIFSVRRRRLSGSGRSVSAGSGSEPASAPAKTGLKSGPSLTTSRKTGCPDDHQEPHRGRDGRRELLTTTKHGVEISLTPASAPRSARRFDDSPSSRWGGPTCEYHARMRRSSQDVEETKAWGHAARDLGSPSVKVRPNGLPKEVPEEKTLEQIGKALAECGAFANDNGVKIQLEVHGEGTSRVPRIRKILDYGGKHPGVRVCWNSNQTDLLDGGFEANFKLLRDQIGQVTCAICSRGVSVPDLIAALSDMKFQGYSLRRFRSRTIRSASQILQRCVPRIPES